jgi:Ca2+-binding RTX toxin-like protein
MLALLEKTDEWLNSSLGYAGFGNAAQYRPGFGKTAFEQAPQITFDVPEAIIHDNDEQSLFLYGSAEEELIEGGDGFDWVFYTDSDAGIFADLSTIAPASGGFAEGDILISIENIAGSVFADTLIGNALGNIIRGDGGDDILLGGAGADTLDGGAGQDMAAYTASDAGVTVYLSIFRAYGGDAEGDSLSAIEQVQGSDFNDSLSGDFRDNMLFGMEGDDILIGHGGNDILSGAGGADTFLFGSGFGQDVIQDFELGADLLIFSDATSMDSFVFEQDGDDTIIRFAGREDAVRLVGVDMDALTAADFMFFNFDRSIAMEDGLFDLDPAADAGELAFESVFTFI